MFNEQVYQNLMNSISELNCPGALKCLTTHWNLDKSIIDIPRTNICAERAVKFSVNFFEGRMTVKNVIIEKFH